MQEGFSTSSKEAFYPHNTAENKNKPRRQSKELLFKSWVRQELLQYTKYARV